MVSLFSPNYLYRLPWPQNCQVGSIWSTLALSVERYLAVVHPFAKYRFTEWKNANNEIYHLFCFVAMVPYIAILKIPRTTLFLSVSFKMKFQFHILYLWLQEIFQSDLLFTSNISSAFGFCIEMVFETKEGFLISFYFTIDLFHCRRVHNLWSFVTF